MGKMDNRSNKPDSVSMRKKPASTEITTKCDERTQVHGRPKVKSYRGELIPPSVRETATFLVRELKSRGVLYVLAGAFPVQFYGRERLSRDVDVVLYLNKSNSDSVYKLLKSCRYTLIYPLEHEQKLDSPSSLFKLNLIKIRDVETDSLVDLILNPEGVGFTFDNESEKRMRTIDIDGEQACIPSPEDYLIMKFKSRRPGTHDFEDIMSTLANQFAMIDWNYLTKRAEKENLTSLLNHYRSAFEKRTQRVDGERKNKN